VLQCVAVCFYEKVYRSYGNDVSRLVAMCVLQCIAESCSVLQCVAACCSCSVLQYVAVCSFEKIYRSYAKDISRLVAMRVLQCVQDVAACCSMLFREGLSPI